LVWESGVGSSVCASNSNLVPIVVVVGGKQSSNRDRKGRMMTRERGE